MGIDDTIERRWGKQIRARDIYRDPVRSSDSHFVKTSGLRWLSLMLLVEIPEAQQVWALPFLTVLALSERYHQRQGHRHKRLIDWARQMLTQVRRLRKPVLIWKWKCNDRGLIWRLHEPLQFYWHCFPSSCFGRSTSVSIWVCSATIGLVRQSIAHVHGCIGFSASTALKARFFPSSNITIDMVKVPKLLLDFWFSLLCYAA